MAEILQEYDRCRLQQQPRTGIYDAVTAAAKRMEARNEIHPRSHLPLHLEREHRPAQDVRAHSP
jgi:hypothetical protein